MIISSLDTGGPEAGMPDGINWRGILLYPPHGFIHIGNYLVSSHSNNHLARAESYPSHPVTDHIRIYQLSLLSQCIASGEKQVHQQRLPAPLDNLLTRNICGKSLDQFDGRNPQPLQPSYSKRFAVLPLSAECLGEIFHQVVNALDTG